MNLRLLVVLSASAAMTGALASDAAAAPSSHGGVVQIVKPRVGLNAWQSQNWYGYNQGALEKGGGLFNSISGDWTVPTASQHTSGQAESSSTWIGIGRGCLDTTCVTRHNTLMQTGTQQDVTSSGKASYSAQ